MKFDLGPEQILEEYEQNLAEARAARPASGKVPMTVGDERRALKWHKVAEQQTRNRLRLTDDGWDQFRRWQTELGPRKVVGGEVHRQSRSGAMRVDRVE